MKKILMFAAFAAVLAACGKKESSLLCVDKFFENPAQHMGKVVSVTGVSKGNLDVLANCSGTKEILLQNVSDSARAAVTAPDAMVTITGTVSTIVIDSVTVAQTIADANAATDSTLQARLFAMADDVTRRLNANGGPITHYCIAPTAVTVLTDAEKAEFMKAKGCCKNGESCCAKKEQQPQE